MDFSYILDRRLAVGAAAWTPEAMAELARRGFTHVVSLQAEFDDTALAAAAGLAALWNPTDDDLAPKPADFFDRSVRFALAALADQAAQLYVHCIAGVHRGPLAAAAILCALGYDVDAAVRLVASRRAIAHFPDPYLASLRRWATARPPA
ncbi:MAG TPA: dual specificity protein phosphatase family protein [Terriglobales bacterium]|nr:dual specificity protein phosphatase family protein [Terriglobales bacterium]